MTPEETRMRILQSAARAFAARGFRASSIKDIARIARVNEVTVYRHFPRKHELYWKAVEWKLSTITIPQLLSNRETHAPPLETLRQVAIQVLSSLDHDPDMARLIYFTALELDAEKSRLYEGHLKYFVTSLENQVRIWIADGRMRVVDPEAAALSMVGLLVSHCNLYKLFGAPKGNTRSVDEIASDYADICLSGLGVLPIKS
jgi:AcrR family transcriptional regulator